MRVDQRLGPHISNSLPEVHQQVVTGIVGDAPSRYAKTPPLWNAVYRDLGWDAISLPWDVTAEGLGGFVKAARQTESIVGFSVTNPHKIAIVPLLDDLDPLARQIGAVNTVARQPGGGLRGYNTDGQGAIDALTMRLPGLEGPFIDGLAGRRVTMIGAGGAARAVAFYLGSHLGPGGALRIVNRDAGKARALGDAVRTEYGVGEGAGEDRLRAWIGDADLVVNASLKGQSGWRRRGDGRAYLLEPYSALGPADPASIDGAKPGGQFATREWFLASLTDLRKNVAAGLEAIAEMPAHAACFDLIYSPLETRFLRDARESGLATQNGKWMNVAQAADAFARKVCTVALREQGISEDAGYDRAFAVMARVW